MPSPVNKLAKYKKRKRKRKRKQTVTVNRKWEMGNGKKWEIGKENRIGNRKKKKEYQLKNKY
jgi:hypothetical protein